MPRGKRTRRITVAEVEHLAHWLAREHYTFDEPIPDFDTRFPHRLESCLYQPFQTYDRKSLYPRLIDKAAILFYLMIKNHPFQNGNKRIAMTTLQTFLLLNGKWLWIPNDEMYDITKLVASSPREISKEIVAALRKLIAKHIGDPPEQENDLS